jgi:cysteine synthase
MWLDQYRNPANPAAHRDSTGPEIFDQLGGAPGTLFVGVSTGGTARGLSDFFEPYAATVVAVDVIGSAALGGRPASRTLTGIGSSRESTFLAGCPRIARRLVAESEATRTCRAVWAETGLMLGGSSGAVLAACARALASEAVQDPIVCVCPDGGPPYAESIYAARHALADGSCATASSRSKYNRVCPS